MFLLDDTLLDDNRGQPRWTVSHLDTTVTPGCVVEEAVVQEEQ